MEYDKQIYARVLVRDHANKVLPTHMPRLDFQDVNLVWYSKTLQHWKALVYVPSLPEPRYYEVTHNGDKNETYIDCYRKVDSDKVPFPQAAQ